LLRWRSAGRASALALLIPIVFSASVYLPLRRVYFQTDDFLNLYRIVNEDLSEYLLTPHGGHVLPTRNALFFAFFHLFGPRADLFLLATLATHLLNVALLFAVLRRWTGGAILAVFGATLWGTCPVHAGTLGWYSVYGQVVVATVLLTLLYQCAGMLDGQKPSGAALALWPFLLFVAATSFGVGIAVACVLPLFVFLILPRSAARRRLWIVLAGVAISIPLLYRGVMLLHVALHGPSAEVDAVDELTAHLEVGESAAMTLQLLGAGITRLALGFAIGSAAASATFLHAALALWALFVVVLASRSSAAVRGQLLGLLLLAGACYGIIALGRAPLFPAERLSRAAATARYHYVATLPVVILSCIALREGNHLLPIPEAAKIATLALWLAFTAIALHRSRPFIVPHGAARLEVDRLRAAVEAAVRAAPDGGAVYLHNTPFRSLGSIAVDSKKSFPGTAGVFTFVFPSNTVEGHRVYFIEDDPAVRERARRGRRTADLLVSSAAAAGQAK
jgi:hypothetical protein